MSESHEEDEGGRYFSQDPLRVVMPMENEKGPLAEGRELMVVGEGKDSQRVEEREAVSGGEQEVVSWEESCLMRFNKCMGLTTKGFEEEIVDLMTKVSEKRYKDKGKGVRSSTRFDKELKRLRWTINEKGRPSVEAVGKGEGVLRAGFYEN